MDRRSCAVCPAAKTFRSQEIGSSYHAGVGVLEPRLGVMIILIVMTSSLHNHPQAGLCPPLGCCTAAKQQPAHSKQHPLLGSQFQKIMRFEGEVGIPPEDSSGHRGSHHQVSFSPPPPFSFKQQRRKSPGGSSIGHSRAGARCPGGASTGGLRPGGASTGGRGPGGGSTGGRGPGGAHWWLAAPGGASTGGARPLVGPPPVAAAPVGPTGGSRPPVGPPPVARGPGGGPPSAPALLELPPGASRPVGLPPADFGNPDGGPTGPFDEDFFISSSPRRVQQHQHFQPPPPPLRAHKGQHFHFHCFRRTLPCTVSNAENPQKEKATDEEVAWLGLHRDAYLGAVPRLLGDSRKDSPHAGVGVLKGAVGVLPGDGLDLLSARRAGKSGQWGACRLLFPTVLLVRLLGDIRGIHSHVRRRRERERRREVASDEGVFLRDKLRRLLIQDQKNSIEKEKEESDLCQRIGVTDRGTYAH
ncbi:hypothetical protein Taro_024709 [Colocasia esculenta]|uniref:Uncharacterized protein n=1 Tax=Colocasia esculenta TaxID=4460 RepID=A0A843VA47_COLES|nr:hypothetical protein [Colocasia esculenta]